MMRLRSFEVSDFRKFDRPVRLEGLGDGINVLAEPNEFGKSTLLAAVKAVLFEQHRAKGKLGEAMRHYQNLTSPVLKLGFELNDGLHRIEKRFMHREPYARLTLPDGTRIEGDEAEERLQELLGFGPPGKSGATADSVGLWGALWVAQQASVKQPELQAIGRATLHGCLENELGTLAGGDRSFLLSSQVKTELFTLIDGNGNPKGRLKEAGAQLATLDASLGQLRDKRAAMGTMIHDLAQLRRDLSHASDANADKILVDDLGDARRRRDAALQHQHVLSSAVAALKLAEQHHFEAEAEGKRRTDRRSKITAAEAAQAAAREVEVRLLEEQVGAQALLADRRDALRSAEAAATTAAEALRQANAVSSLVMRSDQVVRLGAQLGRATAAQAEVNRLTGQLSANPADAPRMRAVTDASGALDRARSVLDALATEVAIDLEPGGVGRLQVSSIMLADRSTVLRIVEDTTIDIVGIGRIRVRPAIKEQATLQAEVASAEAGLAAALRVISAADLAEAARMETARSSLSAQLKAAEAVLKAEAPGEAAIGLKPGLEALRNHVDAGRSRMAADLAALGLEQLPTLAKADAILDDCKREDQAAIDCVSHARIAMAGPEAEHDRAKIAQSAAVHEAAQARTTLAALQAEKNAAITMEAEADLAARLTAADLHRTAQQVLVAQVQRDKPADTVEGMDVRIKRLEEASTTRVDTVRRLREEIAGLTARIAHDEGEGLDEQIAALERRRDDVASEQAALQREAAVLTLLRDTLATAERETRERYVAPVRQRLTPYLQGLFPGVEVELGDDLRITGLTRLTRTEELERLSDGTVEQVAVLLRLAYADLLLAQGKPAMLILDDALAYSDRDRLELIFDVLTRAAERMQVIVLTCRTDAFSRLGGNRLRLVSTEY